MGKQIGKIGKENVKMGKIKISRKRKIIIKEEDEVKI